MVRIKIVDLRRLPSTSAQELSDDYPDLRKAGIKC